MTSTLGPYSPVRRVGPVIVTSGQLGTVPGPDGKPVLVDGGLIAELGQALTNLSDVLQTVGATLQDVVKATLFVTDLTEFAKVNEVWTEMFGDNRPARSAIGVAALPLGASAEVEAWAWIGARD